MRDWLWNNKEWIFSGAGLSTLALIAWVIRRLFRADKRDLKTNVTTQKVEQSPVLNQSPVVNITNNIAPSIEHDRPKAPPDGSMETQKRFGRPDIFTLPSGIENLPAQAFDGAVAHLAFSQVPTYVARFRLAADDPFGIDREITASIEYYERIRIHHTRGETERLALRIDQAFWKGQVGKHRIINLGETFELVIGLLVGARLYALSKLRSESPPNSSSFQAVPLDVGSDPTVRVTFVDVQFGWRWRIDYQMHQFPLDLRETTRLISLRR
jgi:hypothetical protein